SALGPGDLFGFAGNVLYGLVPYVVWEAVTDAPPLPTRPAGWRTFLKAWLGFWIRFCPVVVLASMLCATVVGWGLQALGFHPFTLLGTIVLLNNLVSSLALAPLLLVILYPRIARARLLYRDLLGPRPRLPVWRRALGLALLAAGTVGGFS